MSPSNIKSCVASVGRLLVVVAACAPLAFLPSRGQASAPGIKDGSSFALVASAGYTTQPDGALIYTWGYGCASPTGHTFAPEPFNHGIGVCPAMQLPGPTLIVTEGTVVTITLTNNLPTGAGNTSIIFSGFAPTTASAPAAGQVSASGGAAGILAQEATPGPTGTVSYILNTAGKAGTHAYYSGTQSDLQVEMGLYGALVVLPNTVPTGCVALGSLGGGGEEYRLAPSAYDHPATCYDREYLFQFGEIDPQIHAQAEAQIKAIAACPAGTTSVVTGTPCPAAKLFVNTEPYHPRYYTINGRSMPDNMDADYAPNYPSQPYNGNPHMHPLDQVLLRVIGAGRWEHPFHEHANHVHLLARDGNLMLSPTDNTRLAGRLEFDTDAYPGQSLDGIFYWSAKGLNWDIYGHTTIGRPSCTGASSVLGASSGCNPECLPDANGYFTQASGAVLPVFAATAPYGLSNPTTASLNYGEWCADHNHPLETNPAGQVGAGGPATLPDPLVATNGLWYNGTPYLGPDAVLRSRGPTPLPPGGALQNPPAESGIAFMWHSHNEREITTNDVFPGGMLMMMLVDPPVWYIDETL
jgi:FtsP/CotA-like multicopper oxidase with cupredoxin domain